MKEEKAILVPDNWSDFPLKMVLEIMHEITLPRSKGETAVFTAALSVCVHNSFTVEHPNERHYVSCLPPSQRLCIKALETCVTYLWRTFSEVVYITYIKVSREGVEVNTPLRDGLGD